MSDIGPSSLKGRAKDARLDVVLSPDLWNVPTDWISPEKISDPVCAVLHHRLRTFG